MMSPLHILLLRHGQTDANLHGIVQGHLPTALNALGHQQARLLARRVIRFQPPVDALISSDLPRAIETAEPIARALHLTPRRDPAWRERYYGQLQGTNPQQRAELRRQWGVGENAHAPDAQSRQDYHQQIRQALLALPQQFPQAQCIAVATHGGACRAALALLAEGHLPLLPGGPTPTEVWSPNCALTHLIAHRRGDDLSFQLVCMNSTDHLQELATLTDAG